MADLSTVVNRLDMLNSVMQIQNNQLTKMSNNINADGYIKIIDHVSSKLKDVLPEPIFMKKSKDFALKTSGYASSAVIIIGAIIAIIVFFTTRNAKPKKKTIEYDENGDKLSEVIKEEGSEDLCKKIFKNGKIFKVECNINKGKTPALIGIITIILAIVIFFVLYSNLKKWHYSRAIRLSNPWHKTFIDYIHRLFVVED